MSKCGECEHVLNAGQEPTCGQPLSVNYGNTVGEEDCCFVNVKVLKELKQHNGV